MPLSPRHASGVLLCFLLLSEIYLEKVPVRTVQQTTGYVRVQRRGGLQLLADKSCNSFVFSIFFSRAVLVWVVLQEFIFQTLKHSNESRGRLPTSPLLPFSAFLFLLVNARLFENAT